MSLETLNTRLKFHGGNAEQRLQKDKLRTLEKALLYSYQAETAVLQDGREFRCLINSDKTKPDYDNKMLSIPFEGVRLNPYPSEHPIKEIYEHEGWKERIGIKPGDVFTWKETDTKWLVFLRYLEEDAYFRAQIRRCDQTMNINDQEYWVYIRGPVETSVPFNQKGGIEWNDINYSLVMFITKDANTVDFFHRFKKVKIIEEITHTPRTWQVVGVNPYHGDGIIEVYLDEYYENEMQDAIDEEAKKNQEPAPDPKSRYIDGPSEISQYSQPVYKAINSTSGYVDWFIQFDGEERKWIASGTEIKLDVLRKKSFTLFCYFNEAGIVEKRVTVGSF